MTAARSSHAPRSADLLWTLDATAQAALVRSGEVSARELVQASLDRIEALNPALNAVVGLAAEEALERADAVADGPFAGVPFLTKDLLAYPGQRAAMGSRLFAMFVPPAHVPYTARLEAAGLVCMGKSTSSELGLLGSTETLVDGTTRNPWGAGLSAGGSSGGAAVAVAAGLVPFAHASDGGGSIRLPAALNGLFGFKPSQGATVPAVAMEGGLTRLVSDHCVSRSVRDSDALLGLTAPERRGPYGPGPTGSLRVGLYRQTAFGVGPTEEAEVALQHAARVLTDLGHEVVEVDAPALSGQALSDAFFTLAGSGVAALREMVWPMLGRAPGPGELEPFTLELLGWFDGLGDGAVARAEDLLAGQTATMGAFLESVDVALCPTVGGARPRLGHLAPDLPMDVLLERTGLLAGYTAVHNPTGAPAMSVPLHWTEAGLPVGVQLAAAPGEDERLFRVAYQLEQAAPWADRWPPTTPL